MCALTYEIDYTYLSKLQNISSEGLFDITDIVYTHVVQVTMCLRPENLDEVTTMVKNLTAGKGILKNQRLELVKN